MKIGGKVRGPRESVGANSVPESSPDEVRYRKSKLRIVRRQRENLISSDEPKSTTLKDAYKFQTPV